MSIKTPFSVPVLSVHKVNGPLFCVQGRLPHSLGDSGVLLCAAERCGIPLFEYTPGQVKMAVTGYGKAEKRQVMDMTKRLLKLAKTPRPDDAADALALALCHARSSTSRLPQIKPEKETV